MSKDYYKILGVERDASTSEIKSAYRKMAKEHHPDRGGDETKFKEVSEAYETLKDPAKKQNYDTYGSSDGPQGWSGSYGGGHQGFDAQDIFNQFFNRGGRSRRTNPRAKTGIHLKANLIISFKESYTGCKKKIHLVKPTLCDSCNGEGGSNPITCNTCKGSGELHFQQGVFMTTSSCPTCKGSGQTLETLCGKCNGNGTFNKEVTIDLDIPAGVDDGIRMKLSGMGGDGTLGAPGGDLNVYINVKKSENGMWREDNTLHTTLKLNYTDLFLGKEVKLTLPDGKDIGFTLPAKTTSERIFRVSGVGFANPQHKQINKGDMLIHINLIHPELEDSKAEEYTELVEKMKELSGD
jgi:molecular chaperone DnaJ